MKKIALLITNFEGGGAQKIALTLAEHFPQYGIQMDIITMESLESYQLPESIRVISLSQSGGDASKLTKTLAFPKQIKALADTIQQENYPLVISFLERADFVNILAKKYLSHHIAIPTIHSHLSATYRTEGASLRVKAYTKLVKVLESQADRIVAVSKGIAHDGIQNFGFPPSNTQVIYNPFDIAGIQQRASESISEEHSTIFDAPTIITIGRMSRQKGQWHTLRAFSLLKKTRPEARLIILGDGYLRDNLIQFSHKLGLTTYSIWDKHASVSDSSYDVYFLGFVQNPFQYLHRATAFCLSSHFEGLPNVLVESLICGTPIVATDCDSGPRELLAPDTDLSLKATTLEEHPYGFLTPVGREIENFDSLDASQDELYLATALKTILDNPNLQDTLRKKAEERLSIFSLESSMSSWKNLIDTYIP